MKIMIRETLIICALYSLFISCTPAASRQDEKLPVQAIAVPVKEGWGYELYVDNKLFIKQQNMPAVSGFHSFKSRQEALATANLVLQKMKAGKTPMVSIEDLHQLGINTSF
jgi:Domain of unknown function (DUF4907)